MQAGEEGPELRPGVGASLITLVISFVSILVGGAFLGFLFGSTASNPAAMAAALADPLFLIGAMLVTQVAMLIAVTKLPPKLDDVGRAGFRARIAWWPSRFSWVDLLPTVLGAITAGGLMRTLVQLIRPGHEGVLQKLDAASKVGASSTGTFIALLLFGTIGAAVTEEMMFRGLLQTRFVERYGPSLGIAIPAALFGIWHFDLEQSTAAFGIGLWLGWCAWSQGTIVTVMAAHFGNNLAAFTLHRFAAGAGTPSRMATVVFQVVVFAGCAAFIAWRHRKVDVSTADFPSP